MLQWINDGQREVVLFRPEASITNGPVNLVPGVTQQSIPASGIVLVDIIRNLGSNGSTPGKPIRVVPRDVLDSQVPDWHSTPNTLGYIENFTFDPRDQRHFYVYPMAPVTAWTVECVYSVTPTDCVFGGTIGVDDIYANALVNYVLFRCYSKDATYAANAELAMAYYSAFTSGLTGKSNTEMADNPNRLGVATTNPNTPIKVA